MPTNELEYQNALMVNEQLLRNEEKFENRTKAMELRRKLLSQMIANTDLMDEMNKMQEEVVRQANLNKRYSYRPETSYEQGLDVQDKVNK